MDRWFSLWILVSMRKSEEKTKRKKNSKRIENSVFSYRTMLFVASSKTWALSRNLLTVCFFFFCFFLRLSSFFLSFFLLFPYICLNLLIFSSLNFFFSQIRHAQIRCSIQPHVTMNNNNQKLKTPNTLNFTTKILSG